MKMVLKRVKGVVSSIVELHVHFRIGGSGHGCRLVTRKGLGYEIRVVLTLKFEPVRYFCD